MDNCWSTFLGFLLFWCGITCKHFLYQFIGFGAMGYQFSMDMGTGGQEGLGSWKAFVDVFVGAFVVFLGPFF